MIKLFFPPVVASLHYFIWSNIPINLWTLYAHLQNWKFVKSVNEKPTEIILEQSRAEHVLHSSGLRWKWSKKRKQVFSDDSVFQITADRVKKTMTVDICQTKDGFHVKDVDYKDAGMLEWLVIVSNYTVAVLIFLF